MGGIAYFPPSEIGDITSGDSVLRGHSNYGSNTGMSTSCSWNLGERGDVRRSTRSKLLAWPLGRRHAGCHGVGMPTMPEFVWVSGAEEFQFSAPISVSSVRTGFPRLSFSRWHHLSFLSDLSFFPGRCWCWWTPPKSKQQPSCEVASAQAIALEIRAPTAHITVLGLSSVSCILVIALVRV